MLTSACQRLRLEITGIVQGVGFRPFVYQLAQNLNLTGWVSNSPQGVQVEIEGDRPALAQFQTLLQGELPPNAAIATLKITPIPTQGDQEFVIRKSDRTGPKTTLVLPDLATCSACLTELFDPENRRYRYPFTNCTHCGPRYTIITALPYDRPHTTMAGFPLCDDCQREYGDPGDRRFHAQPNACPICGPQVALWNGQGEVLAQGEASVKATVAQLQSGAIVAVKGLGGFHLMADARNPEAVARLRERKHRPTKPLAVMYPDLAQLERDCQVSPKEATLLRSPQGPIVLLRCHADPAIAANVAPGNPYLGAMLPTTPLHHLLLRSMHSPLIATSGNQANEPICIDQQEALQRLGGIADYFLVHNRPIVRPVDDSIVRLMAGEVMILRRARGYAPLPVAKLPATMPATLAVGAQLKNAIALNLGDQIILSQHIGDLGTPQALDHFEETITSLASLYQIQPQQVCCDAHPDYTASQYAQALGLPCQQVQHHRAHLWAAIFEERAERSEEREQFLLSTSYSPLPTHSPLLGIVWDGTGYGEGGEIWGGEFFRVMGSKMERVAHSLAFPLPGGDRAAREPWRSAMGLLWATFGPDFPPLENRDRQQQALIRTMLTQGVNCPQTTSIGRLFDGVAALIGLGDRNSFEGETAMALEFAAEQIHTAAAYPYGIIPGFPLIFDWRPMIIALCQDRQAGIPIPQMAAKFHNCLIDGITQIAQTIGCSHIVLTGGCFQNRYLTEGAIAHLTAAGFPVHLPQNIPPNDGSIAVGQLIATAFARASKP